MNHFLKIIGFYEFKSFVKEDFNTKSCIGIILLLSVAISINYYFDLEDSVSARYENSVVGWSFFLGLQMILFVATLSFFYKNPNVKSAFQSREFWLYLVLTMSCLAVYSIVDLFKIWFQSSYYESYFHRKMYARLNSFLLYGCMFVFLGIFIGKSKEKVFGLLQLKITWKTYVYFLVCMLPLLAFAATQSDFQKMYPRLHIQHFPENYLHYFLQYEPFYLADFILLEWFFRGFMVLFFTRFLGTKAIVATAVVYCAFHFGKPLVECISSFFGGYILGYIVYQTKSIYGGILVHMGIALLMDVFAILAYFYW